MAVIAQEIEASISKKSELQRRADTTVQILLLSVTAYAFLLLFVTGELTFNGYSISRHVSMRQGLSHTDYVCSQYWSISRFQYSCPQQYKWPHQCLLFQIH